MRCSMSSAARSGLFGALQPQPHAADVGLVRDVVGQDLDHAGAVFARSSAAPGADLVGIARDLGRHRRECRRRRAAPWPRLPTAPSARRRSHRAIVCACRLACRAQVLGQRRRRAHQLFLRARIAHELHEAVDRLGGRREAARCPWRQTAARLAARLVAEPVRNHGLRPARRRLVRSLSAVTTSCGNRRAGGERRRAVHHQDGVGAIVVEQHLQRARISRRVGIADDVDRIAVRPGRRQHGIERRARRRRRARRGGRRGRRAGRSPARRRRRRW